VGIVLLMVGLITVAYSYTPYSRYSEIASYKPSEKDIAFQIEQMEHSPPESLWDLWHQEIVKKGLGDHDRSPFVMARAQAKHYRGNMIGAGSVITVGLVMLLASLVMRGKPTPR
jgi:hypothetical protein